MFYLKINEKIRELLNLSDQIKLGCRVYCKHQLIALDEFELLRIELETLNLRKFTNEEFISIKNSAEKIYFHNTHVCVHENNFDKKNTNTILEEDLNKDLEELEFKPEEIKQRKKADVITKFRVAYDFPEEKNEENFEGVKKISENSGSQGVSMVASFFLIVLGSYYLGIYYLEWSKANTLKLTLVVTIIVFLAEAFLLIIKMHREDMKNYKSKRPYGYGANENIRKNSLAYRLNAKYRESFEKPKFDKTKVMDLKEKKD